MRARGGLLEKKGEAWTRGQRVNDLLYRSLPASSRFLPVCIEPGYHPVSWNNCDRSTGRTKRVRNDTFVVRSPYFVDYFVPDTTKFVALCPAALFRYARSYEALSGK